MPKAFLCGCRRSKGKALRNGGVLTAIKSFYILGMPAILALEGTTETRKK
jgi:hypothetical protein